MQIRSKYFVPLAVLVVLTIAAAGTADAIERDDVRPWAGDMPDGGELFLVPEVTSEGAIAWACSATIAQKQVPAAYRDSSPPALERSGI